MFIISQSNSIGFVVGPFSIDTVKPSNSIFSLTYTVLPRVGTSGVTSTRALGWSAVVNIVTSFVPESILAVPAVWLFSSETSMVSCFVSTFEAVSVPFSFRLPWLSIVALPPPMSTKVPLAHPDPVSGQPARGSFWR